MWCIPAVSYTHLELCLLLQQAHYKGFARQLRTAFLTLSFSCTQGFSKLRRKVSEPFEMCIRDRFYTVTFDEHGQMTGIFDKENRREELKPGQAGNLFRVYEDKPIYYDNWEMCTRDSL